MATLLLIVIYIGFIGLGIPDSLFGAAWPAIYSALDLPVPYSAFVTFTTTGCTLVSSLFSASVLNRFGVGRVAAVSTSLTALALLISSFADSFWVLVIMAVPLGMGAGAIDAGLNNYVAMHYKAKQMNFLHCFYGVGISVSPYLLSFALKDGVWQNGYRITAYVQIGIAVIMIASLPFWSKASANDTKSDSEPPITLTIRQTVSIKGVPLMLSMFASQCSLEALCVAWGTTYLVINRGLSADAAAGMATFYFVGMALGRFVSGLVSGKISPQKLINIGQIIISCAVILLLLPLQTGFAAAGLFLIGFGLGPLYPNLMHLTPKIFGAARSQSIMSLQMSAASFGYLITPVIFSLLQKWLGMWIFPIYAAAMLAVFTFSYMFSGIKKSAQ